MELMTTMDSPFSVRYVRYGNMVTVWGYTIPAMLRICISAINATRDFSTFQKPCIINDDFEKMKSLIHVNDEDEHEDRTGLIIVQLGLIVLAPEKIECFFLLGVKSSARFP